MGLDSTSPRTRRAFLAGALGAAAAAGIDAVARPAPAEATTAYVVLGGTGQTETNTTQIFSQTAGLNAFSASAAGGGTGVEGSSQSGWGVLGFLGTKAADTTTGSGVYGRAYTTGGSTYGVQGVSDSNSGTGVYGHVGATSGSTYGVQGASASTGGTGVFGYASAASGQTAGVHGNCDSTAGSGVLGYASAASGNTRGVYGLAISETGAGVYGLGGGATGSSYGVYGQSISTHGIGVVGFSYGNATGVLGYSGDTLPGAVAKTGVRGVANQDAGAVGVHGSSTKGRGGVFKGGVAQLRLSPSTATSHPTSGAKGDLFVDASGRLWFCKGATTWKQLA